MTNPLQLTDVYQRILYVQCDYSRYLYNWTDYGPCPTQRCYNGGICDCLPAGRYYCKCPSTHTGTFCETLNKSAGGGPNLWPLLVIPALIAALLLILGLVYCCRYCCHCYCAWCQCCYPVAAAEKEVVVEPSVIEIPIIETATIEPPENVYADLRIQSTASEPQTMFYHAVGRPFAVAFNDSTFSGASSSIVGANDRFYTGATGKKMAIVYEDIGGTGRSMSECGGGAFGGTIRGSTFADSDAYYHALGQKLAIAFNDRSFNTYESRPRQLDRTRVYIN